MSDSYCPKRGDIVWLTFTPQAGHRPALILSPASYNEKIGLALVCPITTQVKGYPFEVLIPEGVEVPGVVLVDHVKSLDWKARKARFCCTMPAATMSEVLGKLTPLWHSCGG